MEDLRCQFCWGEDIIYIDNGFKSKSKDVTRLIECENCERIFWEDSGVEVTNLSEICRTKGVMPELCFKDVREIFNPADHSCPKAKAVEFNLICCKCSKRNFGVTVKNRAFKERVPSLTWSLG